MSDCGCVPDDHPCKIADETLAPTPPGESIATMLGAMFAGEFDTGYVLAYHDLHLRHATLPGPGRGNVWEVYVLSNREPVEVLNLAGFRSASDLHAELQEIQADAPSCYSEQVA